MKLSLRIFTLLATFVFPATAGTVVITTLPDASHPLIPLTSVGGIPLGNGVEITIGAFPGLNDDEILDAAATGGFAQLAAAFQPFGSGQNIGDGVDGLAGNFEISARRLIRNLPSPWVSEEISLLIRKEGGQEFMVARFKGKLFGLDPDTGLESLFSLHLADARVIVGSRHGVGNISTSSAPEAGSYDTWMAAFTTISGPAKRLPGADADGDGRSNFLEYATGGNPDFPADPAPCQLVAAPEGGFWLRFSRAPGIGDSSPQVESSGNLVSAWKLLEGTVEVDPNPPSSIAGRDWMRIRLAQPSGAKGFYRLTAVAGP